MEKSIEDKIRDIVRDELEKRENRKFGPRPYEPAPWDFIPVEPAPWDFIPVWPPKENRCSVCNLDMNKMTHYVCSHSRCPSKVTYLLNEDKTNNGGGGRGTGV